MDMWLVIYMGLIFATVLISIYMGNCKFQGKSAAGFSVKVKHFMPDYVPLLFCIQGIS